MAGLQPLGRGHCSEKHVSGFHKGISLISKQAFGLGHSGPENLVCLLWMDYKSQKPLSSVKMASGQRLHTQAFRKAFSLEWHEHKSSRSGFQSCSKVPCL
jgi:hypothetical protein